MAQITINGKQIEAPDGMTVLQVARANDISIPTLCDHPQLTPYGGCRLCVVEVKGMRVPIAACTLPATNGLVVETETPALSTSRKMILSLLFSERNHFCPFCQVSGGDCELQNAAYHEEMTHWPMQPQWNNFTTDTSHPYFILDNNRCILCRRCVRACAEMSGNFTLGVEERGAASVIVADTNVPLGESTCISCGSCVQVCPTGALIDRQSAYLGHDVSMVETKSVCVGCSVGCGVRVFTRNNRVVKIEGDWDSPVNAGTLCKAGRFTPLEDNRERITTPLIRVNGQLAPASWGEAYVNIVEHMKEGVAALASTRLSTEALSMFKGLFANGLKSEMVTSLEEGYPTAMQAGLAEKEGKQLEGKLEMLRRADCVLVVGADLYKSHEVAGFMIKRSLPKGTKLIVITPEETDFTDLANVFLKVKSGNDADVLRAMETIISKEKLARNPEFAQIDESALARTGLKPEDVSEAAHILAQSIAPVLVYGKGIAGADTAEGLETLLRVARLIGAVDAERVGVISLKGEANSLSASQLKLDKSFKLDGQKAVFVALGDGNVSKRMVERLEKAPYLVVQASYASPLTEKADVVLPAANWAEEDGHYLSLEGRLQKKTKVVDAPEGVRDNVTVLAGLAEHLGVKLPGEWKSQLDERTAVTELVLN